jgi:hypothetical protein
VIRLSALWIGAQGFKGFKGFKVLHVLLMRIWHFLEALSL